jgi:monoterpene epsilon-lactone hydrolase
LSKRNAEPAGGKQPPGGERPTLTRRGLAAPIAGLAVASQFVGWPLVAKAAAQPGVKPRGVAVPARYIPTPSTISPQAQSRLNAMSARLSGPGYPPNPPVSDKAAWKARIAQLDKMFEAGNERQLAKAAAKLETRKMGEGVVYVATPNNLRHSDRARIHIHGGAWTVGGGRLVMGDTADHATRSGCVVFGLDYRMPPDHPFPAALDDCVAAYREVIKTYDPRKVAVTGVSSGGNIVAALCLKLRDLGLPLPGAAVMLTPVTDLAQTGDSWTTHMGLDPVVTSHTYGQIALYAAGRDIADPYLSPRLADFTRGFPPTLLQSGTRDILLSDTVMMHRALRKAGVEAELHIWEAMPHAGFGGDTPEDEEVHAQVLRFLDKHLA